jgi:hypothetical protein
MSSPRSRAEIEKNVFIWPPILLLFGIVIGYYTGVPSILMRWMLGTLLIASIFWCIQWLRAK